MKNFFILLVAIFTFSSQVANAGGKKGSYILVEGEGEVLAEPDQVDINISISSRGEEIKKVKKDNDDAIAKIVKILADNKISKDDIQTTAVYFTPEYHHCSYSKISISQCDHKKISFYNAQQTINVRLRDVSAYESVMQGVFSSGVKINISGVSFGYSKAEEFLEQAREKAIKSARKKAEHAAKHLGVEIEKPISLEFASSRGDGGYPIPQRGASYTASDVARSASFSPLSLGKRSIKERAIVKWKFDED